MTARQSFCSFFFFFFFSKPLVAAVWQLISMCCSQTFCCFPSVISASIRGQNISLFIYFLSFIFCTSRLVCSLHVVQPESLCCYQVLTGDSNLHFVPRAPSTPPLHFTALYYSCTPVRMHARTHRCTWDSRCSDGRPLVTGSVGRTGTATIIVRCLIIQSPESGGDPQQEEDTQEFFFSFLFRDFALKTKQKTKNTF